MRSMGMRLTAFALCLMMLFALVACGGGVEDETKDSEIGTTQEGSEGVGTMDTETEAETKTEAKTEAKTETETKTEAKTEAKTETETQTETELPDITIEEDDNGAGASSSTGLKYTAEGYDAIVEDGFRFTKGLTLTFEEGSFAEEFNRVSLSYRSTAPVHVYLTYVSKNGEKKTDDYYLEAGEGVFSCVVTGYVDKNRGRDLSSVRVDTCEGVSAVFALGNVVTETIKVYTGDFGSKTYYIDNGRFKLGVDMGWGGTINYIADMTTSVADLTNLINKHDTGRLVQQSYYGTGEQAGIDFVWGSFNGSKKWPYNPVQGGGQANTASRLIDVEVGDNYVYIKAQPMDWGKVGVITPSYMENKYILEEDYIRVDNRFVDFSGWTHPTTGQELPAFYTVSYLDTFVWYDGSNPWTGDALSSRDDLNFWGDSKYSGDCTFPMRENNTETWCAWVNTEAEFGVGLYVPNIDLMKAGRFAYNGSKSATDNATNYVAPINSIKLVAYEPLEYSYLITTGTTEEIRATFTEHKDFSDNASLHKNYVSLRIPNITFEMSDIDFTIDESYKVFTAPNNAEAAYDAKEKATRLTMTGGDPYLHLNFVLDNNEYRANDYSRIEIVYMIPESNAASAYACQMFTCTGQQTAADASMVVDGRLTKDGKYHTLTFEVGAYSFWTGKINQLRFDFFNGGNAGDVMYVKSIRLIEDESGGSSSDASAEGTKLDFSKADGVSALCNPKDTSITYDSAQKAVKLTVQNPSDVSVALSFHIFPEKMAAEQYPILKIEYMIPKTNRLDTYTCDLFLCAGDITVPNGDARIRSNLIADGKYHTLVVYLDESGYWKGDIHLIRFDYLDQCAQGDVIYVKSMELVP